MRLNLYKFNVIGASPGPGCAIVIAGHITKATALATAALTEENTHRAAVHNRPLSLGTTPEITPFTFPAVLHFESGER